MARGCAGRDRCGPETDRAGFDRFAAELEKDAADPGHHQQPWICEIRDEVRAFLQTAPPAADDSGRYTYLLF